MAIRKEALFPDFTSLVPQDGTVESVQDYTYFSDTNIRIAHTPPPGRLILKLERFDPSNPDAEAPPLNLLPGFFIRIQCLHGFQYREMLRITPVLGGGIVTLASSCNDDPTPGGNIMRVKAYAQHYIDARIYDLVEKRKMHAVNGRYYRIDK